MFSWFLCYNDPKYLDASYVAAGTRVIDERTSIVPPVRKHLNARRTWAPLDGPCCR